mgnify:CR=1 FL=1|jgi:hypothetical protein
MEPESHLEYKAHKLALEILNKEEAKEKDIEKKKRRDYRIRSVEVAKLSQAYSNSYN